MMGFGSCWRSRVETVLQLWLTTTQTPLRELGDGLLRLSPFLCMRDVFSEIYYCKELANGIVLMADGKRYVDKLRLVKSTISQIDVTIYY